MQVPARHGRWVTVQGRLVAVVGVLIALVAAIPARAQLRADYAQGIQLTASDRNVLATWSDGANVFAVLMKPDGTVVNRSVARDTGARDGFVVKGPRTAWNASTRRFLMSWAGPDGARLLQLGRDGRPIGGARVIVPLALPDAQMEVFDLDADPVAGSAILSLRYTPDPLAGGHPWVMQIPIDRRGDIGSALPVKAAAIAARREGGFFALGGDFGDLNLQRLSSAGRRVGPRRRLTRTPVEERGPVLAMHPGSGRAMAVWGGQKGVMARPLKSSGVPAGKAIQVKGAGFSGLFPALAPYGRDGWVLAGEQLVDRVTEVVVRRLDRNGRPVGGPSVVNPGNGDPWVHSPTLAGVGRSVLVGYGFQVPAPADAVVALPVVF